MRKGLKKVAFLVLSVSITASALGYATYRGVRQLAAYAALQASPTQGLQAQEAPSEKTEVSVNIPQGASLSQVALLLQDKGVIKNAMLFRAYVQLKGKERDIKPGKYVLLAGSSFDSILNKLTAGPELTTFDLTVPEGYTLEQIAEAVDKSGFITYDDFMAATNPSLYSYDFLEGITSLEGFLFPQTYRVDETTDARQLIEMMLAEFEHVTKDLDRARAQEAGLSFYDVIKIASLVEREAYVPEERGLISAVIYNRLKKGMRLEIDASLRYGLNKWKGDLTESELKSDNPYNTRVHPGLPPTPICNPGLPSIEAALNPAPVDYLYFVVTDPVAHRHTFSRTYEEHLRAMQQTK